MGFVFKPDVLVAMEADGRGFPALDGGVLQVDFCRKSHRGDSWRSPLRRRRSGGANGADDRHDGEKSGEEVKESHEGVSELAGWFHAGSRILTNENDDDIVHVGHAAELDGIIQAVEERFRIVRVQVMLRV